VWLERLWVVWCRAIHVFGDNQTHESVIERLEAVSTADELILPYHTHSGIEGKA
jgi:hypothetical protein